MTYLIDVYHFYEEPGKTVFIAGTELPGWEEGWMLAGLSAEEIPPEPTLPDLSALEGEAQDGRIVYTLTDKSIDDIRRWGYYLMMQDGWMCETENYDNYTDEYRYIEAFHKDDVHMMILWYKGVTKVIVANERIEDSEESLWAMMGSTTTIVAGEQYIRDQIAALGPAVDRAGTGEGYDPTAGIVYRFTYHGSAEEFDNLVNEAQGMGFTEDIFQDSENDVYEFSAWRYEEYGDDSFAFYVHIILDGEYLEVQMGKNADQPSHKEG